MQRYLPEGYCDSCFNKKYKNLTQLEMAMNKGEIIEALAVVCDNEHNLIVDLGIIKGIIPRDEACIGIKEGTTRDIAIISKVNKYVSFRIKCIKNDERFRPYAILSRREVQQECIDNYIKNLKVGEIVPGRVTHLEPFGCFVDIGAGIIALLPIDAISVSRISHPKDRFYVGQNINVIIKAIDGDKISLSHKELLGTFLENAAAFTIGETVAGIVRSIESYGIFVELKPNLAGLAELKPDVKIGQSASVFIKNIIPKKMKVKLIIVDNFDFTPQNRECEYYYNEPFINSFQYSPDDCDKLIVF